MLRDRTGFITLRRAISPVVGVRMKAPPGQLKLFWDEVDMGNEEIIGVATKFVKANYYSPNPNLFWCQVSKRLGIARFRWKLGS